MTKTISNKTIGRIVRMWRYPVKSMGAEQLDNVDVSWNGLSGDRRWAFVRDDAGLSDFPWMTIRQRHDMSHYLPSFDDPSRPNKSPTSVRTPSGETLDITDEKLGSELYPQGVHLIRQARGNFDSFPLSLITTQTLGSLGKTVGTELDALRFRPNFVIKANDNAPFQEDAWVGSILRIGNLRIRVDQRDSRCLVVTIDPETTERNHEILRTIAKQRQGCLGVYGSTVEPGLVAVGDDVILENDDGS